ncbi:hypothetical protein C8R44DRAFT_651519, partial [Mycena epipterygia]
GEMHFIPSSLNSWYNLPRSFGVTYGAQESWVLNETVRSNIVLTLPTRRNVTRKYIDNQCSLE